MLLYGIKSLCIIMVSTLFLSNIFTVLHIQYGLVTQNVSSFPLVSCSCTLWPYVFAQTSLPVWRTNLNLFFLVKVHATFKIQFNVSSPLNTSLGPQNRLFTLLSVDHLYFKTTHESMIIPFKTLVIISYIYQLQHTERMETISCSSLHFQL